MRRLNDRVGLGWRPELAAGILGHLDRLDVIEVVAENYLVGAGRSSLRGRSSLQGLCDLARLVPVLLHGVSLGLASTVAVEPRRLVAIARLIERVQPEAWSEHLAFVRGGGIEIGHLAAPPRTPQTIAGCLANLHAAKRVVGSLPALENIATLVRPPCSSLDEAAWITAILEGSGAPLLLDLHNLYANALNFGEAPLTLLGRFPLDRTTMIHLSGGRWIGPPGDRRLLDDHLHEVPEPVFDLLAEVARRVPQPLTVIVERDGDYPQFGRLLAQIEDARAALARGRAGRIGAAA